MLGFLVQRGNQYRSRHIGHLKFLWGRLTVPHSVPVLCLLTDMPVINYEVKQCIKILQCH